MNEKSTVRMYFVPKAKIRPALVDMQYKYEMGFSWVRDCSYLKDDDKFAVLVVFTHSYPFLENKFMEWERP